MHDSKAEENVGQKGAQLGYTELALNLVFYNLDIRRVDCLYVLPNTRPDATDFSTGRFNRAIEIAPHIGAMFSETNNVGHKKSGTVNLYIRGSNSRSQLKSIPVSGIVFDELDEMEQANLSLAEERSAGQVIKWNWKISTPTLPGEGINKYYLDSTQEHFFFKCPGCSKSIELKWPDSFVLTGTSLHDPDLARSHLVCTECKCVLEHEKKTEFLKDGYWVASAPGSSRRGFHVSQLYSSTVSPAKLAEKFIKSQSDQVDEQEFHNSNLGMPHVAAGARVTEVDVKNCIQPYDKWTHADFSDIITMGVDVGRVCHVEIDKWYMNDITQGDDINMNAWPKVIYTGEMDFPELVKLMSYFKVRACVIDALPETRKSREFAHKFPGAIHMCHYNHHVKAKNIQQTAKEHTISVNRTSWLDQSLGRFIRGTIQLPKNVSPDYAKHIMAPVKVPKRDNNGESISFYKAEGSLADHFAHARTYAEIALPFALGFGPSTNSDKVQ